LISQHVTPTMSHPHQRPLQPRRRRGTERETAPPKPYHHGRFPGAIHLFATDARWQGICRMRLCLSPLPGLSARTQGDLHRWWVSDSTLPLCSDSIGRAHHLAHPVHLVQGGLYGLAAFRPPLSLDATRGGPRCPLGDAWRAEFGAVCGDWAYLAHGALPPRLCVWPPELGGRADPLWLAVASPSGSTCPPSSGGVSSGI